MTALEPDRTPAVTFAAALAILIRSRPVELTLAQ